MSFAFRHLRTRLALLYAGLFAVALLIVAVVAQVVIINHARQTVRTELATSGNVFDRIWALRSRALSDSADVLARDFGFRDAVASGDRATIESALGNLRARAGAGHAFIVMQDGDVLGNGPAELRARIAELPWQIDSAQKDMVIANRTASYRVVLSPVLAPIEIGWIAFAVALDDNEMGALEKLSAIPLTATIIARDATGWRRATRGPAVDATALAMIANDASRARAAEVIDTSDGSIIALARSLPAAGGAPEAALLLSYPMAKALEPYRSLQAGFIIAGLVGLALVLLGSFRLAGGITRPISELDRAARALEAGDRVRVEATGQDEIGHLGESFNRMADEIAEREHRIAHLVFNDTLTGLPNRVLFREQVDTALKRAQRGGDRMAVVALDLDGFQVVNDTLGHGVGDAVLREVAAMLTHLSGDAFVARLWGDEFAVLLADLRDSDRPRALADAIVDALRQPMQVEGHTVLVGGSIGIAIGPADGEDVETLLKNADLAVNRAKHDGRGLYRFFEASLDAEAQKRRQTEIDLRLALSAGQLSLDFQPIYALEAERIVGLEALLRWRHPERGLIPPVEFIPIAEESGLIMQIGEWVLHEACRHAVTWPGSPRIAVNVSPIQFRNPGLSAIIFQALSRSGLSADRLEIEITESMFLEGADETIALLHRLRALGIRIALDDFGTGYSSLSYLRSFPFDKIKIDRSFVTPVAEHESAAAIVRAIIDLAAALGMDTTAEGVEMQSQLDELRAQGCATIQGYLISRPVSADKVAALLGERQRRVA